MIYNIHSTQAQSQTGFLFGSLSISANDEQLILSAGPRNDAATPVIKRFLESTAAKSGCFPVHSYEFQAEQLHSCAKQIHDSAHRESGKTTYIYDYRVDDVIFKRAIETEKEEITVIDKWKSEFPANICTKFILNKDCQAAFAAQESRAVKISCAYSGGLLQFDIVSPDMLLAKMGEAYCTQNGKVDIFPAIEVISPHTTHGTIVTRLIIKEKDAAQPFSKSSHAIYNLTSRNENGTIRESGRFGAKVQARLTRNRLDVEVKFHDNRTDMECAFYLRRLDAADPIQKIGYGKHNCSFALSGTGAYFVRVFLKTKDMHYDNSEAFATDVFYFDDQKTIVGNTDVSKEFDAADRLRESLSSFKQTNKNRYNLPDPHLYQAYLDFLQKQSEWITPDLPNLPIVEPNYPFGEIALVVQTKSEADFDDFAARHRMIHSAFENCDIISTYKPIPIEDRYYFFEGNAFVGCNLIVGSNDVDVSNADLLKHACGEFSLAQMAEGEISFSTDYFGVEKIYYYWTNDGLCASTSYHMLLLLLKELHILLEFDRDNISSKFAGYYIGINAYMFSENTDIKNVKLLRPDKQISVREGHIILDDTPLYQAEIATNYGGGLSYEQLAANAVKELTDNAVAIFSHPDFDEVVVDLTDGLDTRTNIAAISRLDRQLQNKLRIRTEDTGVDLPTALGMANRFGFQWYEEHYSTYVTPPISDRHIR
jgi:hypothetical protein